MANRKEKMERGTFGAAPVLAALPSVKGLDDDAKMFAAIGHIGGNMQFLVCSTMFFFGSLAKKNKVKYNGGKAWDEYYKHSGLSYGTDDSKRSAKQAATVYAEFAQMKAWDTQELAGIIFDHPHGSQGQKASAIRKIIADHADKPPSEEELTKLLPKKKSENNTDPTVTAKARGIKTSVKTLSEDETLMAIVESNDELQKRFDTLQLAATRFFDMAETVEKKAKAGKADKAEKAAVIAAAAKKTRTKGQPLHS